MRNCYFLLVFSLCFIPSISCGEDGSEKDRIAAIWKMQQTALVSGEFHFRELNRNVPSNITLERDEVRSMIQRLNSNPEPEVFAEIAGKLDPRLVGIKKPWSKVTNIYDGTSHRSYFNIPGREELFFTCVKHKGYDIFARPVVVGVGDQVEVFRQGGSQMYVARLKSLAFVPKESFISQMEIADTLHGNIPGDRIAFSGKGFQCIVNSETGFVYEMSKENFIGNEIMQFGPNQYDGGIVLPTLYFKGNYKGKRLSRFTLKIH